MDYRSGLLNKLNNGGALHEKDILCILLSNAFGGRDMTAVAERLLACFPGVKAVISADYAELINCGIPANVAAYLKALGSLEGSEELNGTPLKSNEQFIEFARGRYANRAVEYVELYPVDKNFCLINIFSYTINSIKKVVLPVNKAVKDVAACGAHALYIVHNHVNCPAEPSAADNRVTEAINTMCKLCKLKFLDHFIINNAGDYYSYLGHGLLK